MYVYKNFFCYAVICIHMCTVEYVTFSGIYCYVFFFNLVIVIVFSQYRIYWVFQTRFFLITWPNLLCVTLPLRISNLNFYNKFIWNMRIKIYRKTFFPVSLGIIASFVAGDKIIGYFDRDFFPTLAQLRRYTELPKEPFLRETSNLFPCKSITFKDGR